MGLSKLSAKCQECPFADACDKKEMEALGFLPNFWDNPKFLIGTDQSSGGLVRTSGEIDIDVEELVRTIAGVLQLPERVLTGAFTSAENEKQWQRFLEINGMR